MPDEQQMEPSEPQRTTRPAPAAQPEPAEEPQAEQDAPAGVAALEPEPAAPPDETPPDGAEAGDDDDGADDDGADDDGPTLDAVVRERDAVVRERDAHYDRLLRVTAEFDNYRKRTERERRELVEQAAGDLLGDLLPVVDDLERALAADTGDGDAYRRGVEIIRKQLLEVMTRRGVAPIEAVGTDFDPTLHQAVAHEPSDGHRDGEVVAELRRGYTLRQRLLRPSMVKVAKA